MLDLINVEKPARYTGGEFNEIVKDHSKMRSLYAFCFPDTYEIGMSHLGMRIMYHIINEREHTACERVFAPWLDMEEYMRETDTALFSLETKTPLDKFDILGFTLQYEMSYTNILNMLDLSNIPIRKKDRNETHPIIMAGGPCVYNPSILEQVVDVFVIGEAEEVIHEILDMYEEYGREEFLKRASKISGVYVPNYYDGKNKVTKRIIKDLDNISYPTAPIVPYINIVHDRAVLELFRGCIHGCRFCQAGFTYRPVREKSTQTLICQTKQLIDETGYDEIGLVSLSTSDYRELKPLLNGMIEHTEYRKVNFSVPSMRIDNFSMDFMKRIQKVRKSGLTFAPEAGTQRLRDVINKNINEQEIMESVMLAKEGGYTNIKLYFMLGLPTETDEDVIGIADLANKILSVFGKNKRINITVSTSFFIPKPFTPFQWCEQITTTEMQRRQKLLSSHLTDKRIRYNWHDFKTSIVESAVSRGDKQVGEAIIRAWQLGAKFDSWSEHFDMKKWETAFSDAGMDIYEQAAKKPGLQDELPWDFIDIGVTKSFFQKEYEKSMFELTTPNCREECSFCGATKYKCGVCFENNTTEV